MSTLSSKSIPYKAVSGTTSGNGVAIIGLSHLGKMPDLTRQ